MYSNIKPLVSLSNINALPDSHLHSKISFLKSIINEEQNPQIRQMKQRMYKLSYTIKNIGIHGEQIGITSKRTPLKQKEDYTASDVTSDRRNQIYRNKYLPHNNFYSQALVPVKKQKPFQQQQNSTSINPLLVTASLASHNEFAQTFRISSETKFAKKSNHTNKFGKNFSHASKFKNTLKKHKNQKQQEFIQKIITKSHSQNQILHTDKFKNKKSFAKLLNEAGKDLRKFQILPLQHEENQMFKKIKKLQQISSSRKLYTPQKFKSLRQIQRNSSTLVGRYQTMISTARNFNTRRTLSKID